MKKLLCALLAAVMILAMAACGKDESKAAYEQAVAAYNSGDYEAAYTMLTALGDYQDSADEVLQARYGAALELLEKGSFEQARVEFILHVAFQNAVLNQHVVLAWRTFVINRHRTTAIDHRAIINHGTQF